MRMLILEAFLWIWGFVNCYENLSRRPTTKLTQSSTYGSLNADLANDGILNTIEKYCAHTAISHTKAWLQVDLGKMFSINNVKIYYRNEVVTGWKQYRFRQFHLDVSILRATETTAVERTRCYTDNTTAPYLPSTTIDIPCKETARYVIVETTYDAPEDDPITGAVLEICEIEVYGCEVGQYGDYCKCCEGCKECDIENGKCAVKHPELSSQSHDQSCDQSILYGVISAFCFSLVFNIIFIIWSFRNKECREKGQEKDVNSSGQTSTNAPSTDPVLYKIGEDNAAYQELRVP